MLALSWGQFTALKCKVLCSCPKVPVITNTAWTITTPAVKAFIAQSKEQGGDQAVRRQEQGVGNGPDKTD